MIDNKVILITGGTGSFGKQFIKTILLKHKPKKVIIYSRDELKQFEMAKSDNFKKYSNIIRYFIGDIRDLSRLVFALNNVDIIVHAAALKHVPTAEYNPFEFIKTNIIGGQNIVDAAISKKVNKVIALSTDKAAAPINLYGATKLCSDKLFVSANNYSGYQTRFSVVRYGNVMNSRGSVIPTFLKSSKKNILTITDKRMTRFNITLQQGADFVLNCLKYMNGGEIFVPKIPSYRITDVAKAIAPKAKQKIIGIRPGEKIHEQMITSHDSINTFEFNNYFAITTNSEYFTQKQWKNYFKKKKLKPAKLCKEGFSYSSEKNKNFLSISQIKKLIKKNIIDEKI